MAISGDLFGSLVSDLVPKSTRESKRQFCQLPELRVSIQQQLADLKFYKERSTYISMPSLPSKHGSVDLNDAIQR